MSTPRTPAGPDEAGFSLTEMVAAMLMLAVVALALFPVVTQATKAAADEVSIATASRLASKQLELLRTGDVTCASLSSSVSTADLRDAKGTSYAVKVTVPANAACPGLVPYTVSVARVKAPDKPLATASTYVLVERA